MKKLFLSVISFLMIICFSVTAFAASKKEPVKGTVSLNKSSIVLYAYEEGETPVKGFNQSYKLKATTKSGYIVKDYSWSSSNPEVAEIAKDGMIKAKAPGTATITVKSYNGKASATCKVTVYKYYSLKNMHFMFGKWNNYGCSTIYIDSTMDMGQMIKKMYPDGNLKLSFSSSNTKIATIKNGMLKGIKEGKATITIKDSTSGTKMSFSIMVLKPCTVELSQSKITMKPGTRYNLKMMISGDCDATWNMNAFKTLEWKSSNEKVATIDHNGKISAIAPGTTTITAISFGDKAMGTCTLTVKK